MSDAEHMVLDLGAPSAMLTLFIVAGFGRGPCDEPVDGANKGADAAACLRGGPVVLAAQAKAGNWS